jgi:inosine-uridine nucleoside N-ribohydrolase
LSGNVPAQSTFENAVRACQMVGINSIALGKAQEKKEDAQNSAAHIHGNDGIGGLSKILPPIKKVDHHDSVELIINTINKYPNQMEVLVVGPMTNLAKAEEMQPGILKKIKRIIAMG